MGQRRRPGDGLLSRNRRRTDRDGEHRDDEAHLADLGYRPNVNQVRQEPMPASHHADQGQEAEVRNEQSAAAAAGTGAGADAGAGSTGAVPSRPDGEVDTRPTTGTSKEGTSKEARRGQDRG